MQLKVEGLIDKLVNKADVASGLLSFISSFPLLSDIPWHIRKIFEKPRIPDLQSIINNILVSPHFSSAILISLGGYVLREFGPEGYTKYGNAAQKVAAGILIGNFLAELLKRSHNPHGIESTSSTVNPIYGY